MSRNWSFTMIGLLTILGIVFIYQGQRRVLVRYPDEAFGRTGDAGWLGANHLYPDAGE